MVINRYRIEERERERDMFGASDQFRGWPATHPYTKWHLSRRSEGWIGARTLRSLLGLAMTQAQDLRPPKLFFGPVISRRF